MLTRKDYLDGRCSHSEYYADVLAESHVKGTPLDLDRVRTALEADEHLNTIPLREWDVIGFSLQAVCSEALRRRGDFPTLAGGVCLAKEAARQAAR